MGWLTNNTGVLSVVVAAVPLLWGAFQYILQKRQEQKTRRFETYHELIQRLVEREDENRPMRLDRQLAVVFELRRFTEYYEPSLRILRGLKEDWATGLHDRLLEEIDTTIYWMESRIAEVHPAVPKIRATLRRITSSLYVTYSEK